MTFTDEMQVLVAKELSDGHADPERMGEMIARLTGSLALVIATATRGQPEAMDTMLTGASQHLYEMAAEHAPIASFMAGIKRQSRR